MIYVLKGVLFSTTYDIWAFCTDNRQRQRKREREIAAMK